MAQTSANANESAVSAVFLEHIATIRLEKQDGLGGRGHACLQSWETRDGHGAEGLLKYSYCIGRKINSFLSLFISLLRIQIQPYCPCLVMVLHLSYRWGKAPAKLLSGEEEVIPQKHTNHGLLRKR